MVIGPLQAPIVADMQPFDLAVPPDRIGDSVQTVADAAVDAPDPGGEGFNELIGYRSSHLCTFQQRRVRDGAFPGRCPVKIRMNR
jgi:hypothetical protein